MTRAHQEHPLHHVRPAALGLSVLLRASQARHAQHRCAGGPGRALHARLRAVARVRRLAHELLHRPLRAIARRGLERRAAEGGRDDARRLPAPARRADGAGRQDAHARRPRGHAAARHRSRTRSSACASPSAASTPTSATTGCTGSAPTGATTRRCPRYNRYLNDKGYAGDNPWHDWANAAQGEGNSAGLRLGHAACEQARARARGGLRDALHDAARHGFHRRGRRRALVPAPLLHQAALALHRARALQRHVRRRRRAARRALARRSGATRIPIYRRVHGPAREPDVRARGGARGGDPRLHGAHQADRRSAGPAVPLHARSGACSRPP